jgi:hypothetical protein
MTVSPTAAMSEAGRLAPDGRDGAPTAARDMPLTRRQPRGFAP